ncbi:odorant receptor 10-like [Halyomorpha halys]|uniref:odorant receptor 10-like n=1 Tax=Halyomorpha halys TaxID=286706 RepID=UPI0034D338B9|nr:Odorant receptor 78 [Halyomorpha halys]
MINFNMSKSALRDLPIFLEKTCLMPNNKCSKIKQIFVTFYITILLFFGFASLPYSGLRKSLEGPAFLNMIGVITISHQFFFYCNQDQIKVWLNTLQAFQKRHVRKWEKVIFKNESKMIWNLMYYYSNILIAYLVFYQILPFVIDTLVGIIFPKFPSVRVPIFAQGLIDLTKPRTLINISLSILSIMWCCLEILCHIGGQAFKLVSIAYLRVELKIIKEKILIIKNMLNKKSKIVAEKLLKDVILHHQAILEGLDTMKSTLGFPVALENTTISVCLCLNLYGIIVLEGKENIAAKLEGFSGMLVLLVLFWSCSLGESLEDENSNIFQSLYDLPWYSEDIQMRKTLIMMLRQTNKPFVINYHQRTDLNLCTFMQIINASYSYFTVLRSTTS